MRKWWFLAVLVLLGLPGRSWAQDEGAVPVAARALPRGAVLEEKDIAYRPAGSLPGAPASAARAGVAAGWVTKRVIAEGEPLREPAVSPPALIKSGDVVQLTWTDGRIGLKLMGRAMNAATAGGRVTVRVDTERRFEGVAIAAGQVRMDSPSRSR